MHIRFHILEILILLIGSNLLIQSQDLQTPVIRFITVDTLNGNVIMEWENKSNAVGENYEIYEYKEGNIAYSIDTVDASTTSYIITKNDAGLHSVAYTLGYVNDPNTAIAYAHHTIYTSVRFDTCQNSLIIDWTPYIGWKDKLIAYNIHIRTGQGETFKILSQSPLIQSYTFSNVNLYTQYFVFVEAVSSDSYASYSNVDSIITNRATPPSYINADYATVTGDNLISLSFSFDPASQTHDFILFYGTSIDNVTQKIAEFNNVLSSPITYTHKVFSVKRIHNYYQLAAVDRCPQKNPLKRSNIASNIILEAEESNKVVSLSWGDYQKWIDGVQSYNVYRITDETNVEKIDSFNFGTNTISDDLKFLRNGLEIVSDKVCYYIEAEETDDNPHGIKGFSRSNVVCISLVPDIFIANAFTPDGNGHNDRIKPVLTYRPDEYYFTVFDRWNSKIFETTDPDEYWNGEINGRRKAPPGVYVYYLKITTSGKIIKEMKGTITLFYP